MDVRKGWRRVGIEPMMFLYMFGFMVTTVIEDAFFVYKACHVDFGYPDELCRNISQPAYEDILTKVQLKVSTFHQWNNIAYHMVPIILSFYIGSWCDRVGRKLPILIGIAGNLYYSSMIVLIDRMETWPLDTVIWLASFPCALTGSSLTVFTAAFSYLVDTTSTAERTLRSTWVEVAYLLPMPLGVASGSYLFSNVVNQSFAVMFVISASLHASAMIVAWILLEWKTNQSARTTHDGFSLARPVIESFKAIFRLRTEKKRCFLLLSLLAMMLYTFQRDEKPMLYLVTIKKFNWDVSTFSSFRTFQTAFFVGGLLVGGPVLVRVLKLKDTFIIMIGALSHALARVIFIVGDSPKWLYGGAVTACLGPVVPSVLRSFISKLVPPSEIGKVFAMLTVTDTAVPVISGVIYTQVFNLTAKTRPELIFLVTLTTQAAVFLIGLSLTLMLRGKILSQEVKDTTENGTLDEKSSVEQVLNE